MPKDLVTPTTLYQEGMELKEGRNYKKAKELFKMCLQKDPLYINAMSALTEIYYRSMQYDSALYYANSALQLDTYDAGANYFAGVTYHAQGNLTDALESLGWAARWPEYRSAGYAQMAQIQLQLNDKQLTEHYANLALDYDRNNINALQVLAVLYRKSGETVMADKFIQTLSTLDPLSHFADFERYLLHNSSENLTRFTSSITNEMPYQTYLELGMIYYGSGLKNDALAVLEKSPAHPLVTIWRAYLKDDVSLLNEAASASPAYVFPYRTETVTALKWALSKNNNWKFRYYLALNYAAVQRDADAMKLFDACGQEPDYAPFYLTRANLEKSKDEKKELSDLLAAQKLDPDDWRTYHKLIEYYNNRQNYQMTLTLATEAVKKHKDNPDIGVQYAIALINNGQYSKSLKALEGMNILPSEGARLGKVVFEQASLFLAADLIKNKKYGEAIKMTEKSKEWPENLGVGKPYDVDTRVQDYLDVYCLEKMKKSGETAGLQTSIVDYTKSHKYPSFSNILAVETLKDEGDKAAAEDMVKKLEGSDNPVQRWVVATAKNDQSAITNLEKEFASNTNFLVIKKVLEVTGK
jgi:tetratricopeptide (TPR) repeat protein